MHPGNSVIGVLFEDVQTKILSCVRACGGACVRACVRACVYECFSYLIVLFNCFMWYVIIVFYLRILWYRMFIYLSIYLSSRDSHAWMRKKKADRIRWK